MQKQTQRWILTGATAALSVFLAVPAARSQNAASPGTDSGTAAAQPAQKSIQMVPALASLDKGLDAKKAKQGDAVTAKLQKDITSGDTQIPKNTVLMGHVDQVQASESKSNSTVVVTFDQAKLKNGQVLPVKATVIAISSPVNLAAQSNNDSGGGAATPPSGGGGSTAGHSAASGGGSSGGSSAGGAQPQPMPTSDMQTPSGQPAAQQPAGVPGVTLTSDIHQQDSATFTSKGKNVRLPDGTQMQFALAVVPARVKIQ
jgi:hypothetical protein